MAVKKVPQTTVIRSRKSVHVLTGAYFTDPWPQLNTSRAAAGTDWQALALQLLQLLCGSAQSPRP